MDKAVAQENDPFMMDLEGITTRRKKVHFCVAFVHQLRCALMRNDGGEGRGRGVRARKRRERKKLTRAIGPFSCDREVCIIKRLESNAKSYEKLYKFPLGDI